MEIFIKASEPTGLTQKEIEQSLLKSVEGKKLKKVLLVPPDFTRFHSNAGFITNFYYHYFINHQIDVDILPALGTHVAMSKDECEEMYGDIPYDKFIYHNWRTDVINIGEVPKAYIKEITEGIWDEPVTCEVNKLIMDESYDLILSIGQVVPHEVIGMANHSKNILVGCGGKKTINQSHMIGAVYGMEKMMGKDHTPVRKVLDYAMTHYLNHRPIVFVLTVTTAPQGLIQTHGLFIGDQRNALEQAIIVAQEKNINFVEKGIKKCIVYLDPKEFKSTWLGNKSIYRTRMAVEDNGELLVLAEGIQKFGEDPKIDQLIRKYGYCGRLKVLDLFHENEDLKLNMSAAAHLIHSSSDGRFKITYAVKNISKEEIESVHFSAADYKETVKKYDPKKLNSGWNIMPDGEEIYFIPNPALGLWIDKNRF
ncbi:MAG: lactate racemase domain-containing protein [Acholeplasmataceae bacterium]|nr:lactate racemase domain-containing protein [Acholeplasmataceae bacterium]